MEYFKELWNEACDPGGLAYDDGTNNRAFIAQRIGCTINAPSISFYLRNNRGKVPAGLPDNTSHGIQTKGPGGRYNVVQPQHYSVFKSSKNIDACKDFLRYMISPDNYTNYISKCQGFYGGVTPKWESHEVWNHPVLKMLPQVAKYGRNYGHGGPNFMTFPFWGNTTIKTLAFRNIICVVIRANHVPQKILTSIYILRGFKYRIMLRLNYIISSTWSFSLYTMRSIVRQTSRNFTPIIA
jgi:ABC-type glycerol-3-phosphate transport system substrate-binding protein